MHKHRLLGCGAVVAVLLWAGRSLAEDDDVVRLRNGISVRGTILSHDASGVRIQLAGRKQEKFYPAEEIETLDVRYVPEQVEGEKLFEARDYGRALEKLRVALKSEGRPWLRARIEVRIIWCHMTQGNFDAAVEVFVAALQTPGSKLPWSAIPLWWLPEPPGGAVHDRALPLARHGNPLLAVLGASYLFGTADAAAARQTLERLVKSEDSHVGQLARAQLWRWEAGSASVAQVAAWQRAIEQMPAEVRGGPHFVAGLALARLDRPDAAALEFLWVPLAYAQDERLAARALLLAAGALEQSKQPAEARMLYQELGARFPRGPEAITARARLEALKE
jgi:tetratricopeptide (TPR) repeat protein